MRNASGQFSWFLISLLLVGLVGCPKPPGTPDWADQRIDNGDTLNEDPESWEPQLCVSGKFVYVAWHDARAVGSNNVFLQVSQDKGTSWNQTDMQVNTNPDGDYIAENPAIACDGQSVFLVWEDDRDGDLQNKAIYFNASSDAGGSWFANDVNLTEDLEGDWNSYDPQIDFIAGEVFVAWSDGRDGAYDIYFNRSPDEGQSWMGAEVRVDSDETGAAYSAKPRMVVDGIGNVHMAWEDLRSGTNDIYFASSSNNGTSWGADADIEFEQGATAADSFGADIDAEAEGLVAVVWHDLRNGDNSDIYAAVSTTGGMDFLPPLRLDAGSGPAVSDSLFPQVTILNGAIYVVFRDDRQNAGFDVFFTKSTDSGASFTEELAVDLDQGGYHSVEPRMAVDGSGNVVVGWTDLGDGSEGVWEDILYARSEDFGDTWIEEEFRVDDDERSTARSIDMQMELQEGELFFVWSDYRMGLGDIFFRRTQL